jgi:hypothetical protein
MRYLELIRKNGPLTLFAVSGVAVLRALRHAEQAGLKPLGRRGGTYTVEINRDPDSLPTDAAQWPAALTALAVEVVDVQVDPIPGRHTTRLRATARDGYGDLGRRVRETKQILETGEILRSPAVPDRDATAGELR